MLSHYKSAIKDKKSQNLYRDLHDFEILSQINIKKNGRQLISFCSNDYLGLAQNHEVKKVAIDVIEKFGVGATASRFISGNNSLYAILENELANFKNADDSLIFSSGYACAIGVIPALIDKYDLVITDRLIHSCLIDGIKLSGAKMLRFKHNDMVHCQKILQENRSKYKKCLIISESVFSMDGDLGKVDELLELSQKFNSLLLIDYAHDLGIDEKPAAEPNFLKMGTLSKSLGALGGYIAADNILIDYLRNFSKSLIYSTALPPAILASAIKSLELLQKGDLGQNALRNAEFFCDLMNLPKPQSAIIPIIIGDSKKTLEIAQKIEEKGYLISAIRSPTVEKNKDRLRITFSAIHELGIIRDFQRELVKIIVN